MKKREKERRMGPLFFFCCVGAGIAVGALLVLGLEEEQRKRIAYTISELKEMPFRLFI